MPNPVVNQPVNQNYDNYNIGQNEVQGAEVNAPQKPGVQKTESGNHIEDVVQSIEPQKTRTPMQRFLLGLRILGGILTAAFSEGIIYVVNKISSAIKTNKANEQAALPIATDLERPPEEFESAHPEHAEAILRKFQEYTEKLGLPRPDNYQQLYHIYSAAFDKLNTAISEDRISPKDVADPNRLAEKALDFLKKTPEAHTQACSLRLTLFHHPKDFLRLYPEFARAAQEKVNQVIDKYKAMGYTDKDFAISTNLGRGKIENLNSNKILEGIYNLDDNTQMTTELFADKISKKFDEVFNVEKKRCITYEVLAKNNVFVNALNADYLRDRAIGEFLKQKPSPLTIQFVKEGEKWSEDNSNAIIVRGASETKVMKFTHDQIIDGKHLDVLNKQDAVQLMDTMFNMPNSHFAQDKALVNRYFTQANEQITTLLSIKGFTKENGVNLKQLTDYGSQIPLMDTLGKTEDEIKRATDKFVKRTQAQLESLAQIWDKFNQPTKNLLLGKVLSGTCGLKQSAMTSILNYLADSQDENIQTLKNVFSNPMSTDNDIINAINTHTKQILANILNLEGVKLEAGGLPSITDIGEFIDMTLCVLLGQSSDIVNSMKGKTQAILANAIDEANFSSDISTRDDKLRNVIPFKERLAYFVNTDFDWHILRKEESVISG